MAARIGIIGKGNVGSALEQGLSRNGHEVRTVGKDPDRVREVASWADTLVLAVPYTERENAFQEMGDGARGKVVVDVTNALTAEYDFAASAQRSGAEELQQRYDEARIVKAFNTVFAEHMADGHAAGETLSLFVAGNDPEARRRVLELGQELGFDGIDAGDLPNARWLEALGFLNITLGHKLGQGTDTGFRYVHPGGRREREPVAATR